MAGFTKNQVFHPSSRSASRNLFPRETCSGGKGEEEGERSGFCLKGAFLEEGGGGGARLLQQETLLVVVLKRIQIPFPRASAARSGCRPAAHIAYGILGLCLCLVLRTVSLGGRLLVSLPPTLPPGTPPWVSPLALPLSGGYRAVLTHTPELCTPLSSSSSFAATTCASQPQSYVALVSQVHERGLEYPTHLPTTVSVAVRVALHGGSEALDETLAPPPRLLASTAHGFCAASPSPYSLDFQYSLVPRGCPGGETRTFAPPWCHRPSNPAMVYYTECAWVESYVQDNWEGPLWRVVGGSVLGGLGSNSSSTPPFILADALSRDHRPAGVWPQAASTGGAPPTLAAAAVSSSLFHSTPHIFHHPLLATPGPMRCAWCPGHFILELLPVLLLMDTILPPHIPLLWPTGALPQAVAAALRTQGALSRTLVLQPREPTLHRVDRLLYFQSGEAMGGGVPTSWIAQRAANEMLRGMVVKRGAGRGHPPPPPPPQTTVVVVLALRVGATTRQLDNVEAVVGALEREIPGPVVVDAFTPGEGGFLEDGGRFERACLLVGVHGANLANAMFMRPGCTLIELGSVDMFTDYYCLARNLGLRYFVSLGENGGHGEARFTANVTELALILRTLVAEGGLQG